MEISVLIIRIIHALFIIFMVYAPFAKDMELVALHFVLVPFLYIHWLTNDATCFLTLVEKNMRGVGEEQSFFHSLLAPIYQFHKDEVNYLVWFASYALWLVSLYRLQKEEFQTLKLILSRTPIINLFVKPPGKTAAN